MSDINKNNSVSKSATWAGVPSADNVMDNQQVKKVFKQLLNDDPVAKAAYKEHVKIKCSNKKRKFKSKSLNPTLSPSKAQCGLIFKSSQILSAFIAEPFVFSHKSIAQIGIIDSVCQTANDAGETLNLLANLNKFINNRRESNNLGQHPQLKVEQEVQQPVEDESFILKLLTSVKDVDWVGLYKKAAPIIGISLVLAAINLEDDNLRIATYTAAMIVLASSPFKDIAMSLYTRFVNVQTETQSGVDVVKFLVVSIWSYYMQSSDKNCMQQILGWVKSFGSISVPFDILIDKVFKLMNTIFDGICDRLGLVGGSISRRLDIFMDNCKSLIDRYESDSLPKTAMMSGYISDLIREGESIHTTDTRVGGFALSYYLKRLYAIQDVYASKKLGISGLRVEPVFLVLRGCPGVGKTSVLQHLSDANVYEYLTRIKDEVALTEFETNPTEFTFNRAAETKYWDGYNFKKLVTFFDDLGQMKDVAGNPDNEWMNVIRAVNENAFPLHMAELSKKATTFFTSKYVFASTNLTEFRPESIISAEAFERRIDFDVVVVPKDAYLDEATKHLDHMHRKLDKSKLPKGFLTTDMGPNILDFYVKKQRVTRNCVIANYEKVDYQELVMKMAERQLAKEEYFEEKIRSKREQLELIKDKFQEFHETNAERIFRLYSNVLDDELIIPMEPVAQVGEFDNIADSRLTISRSLVRRSELFDKFKQCNSKFFENVEELFLKQEREGNHGEYVFTKALSDNYPYLYNHVRIRLLSMGVSLHHLDRLIENFGRGFIRDLIQQRDEYVHGCGIGDWYTGHIDVEELIEAVYFRYYEPLIFNFKLLKSRLAEYFADRRGFLRTLYDHLIGDYDPNQHLFEGYNIIVEKVIMGMSFLTVFTILAKFILPWLYKPKGRRRKKTTLVQDASKDTHVEQATTQALDLFDDQTNRVVNKILRHNCFIMKLLYPTDHTKKFGQVTFLKTNYVLLPQHFIRVLKRSIEVGTDPKDYKVVFESPISPSHDMCFTYEHFLEFCGEPQPFYSKDIGVLKLTCGRPMRDITEYFFTETARPKEQTPASLLMTDKDGTTCLVLTAFGGKTVSYNGPPEIDNEAWEYDQAYSYDAPTRQGFCGMLLVDTSNKNNKMKILGMHVAGITSMWIGHATVLTQEIVKQLTTEQYGDLPSFSQSGLMSDEKFDERFVVLSKLDKYPNTLGHSKSAFIKTPMHGRLGKALKSLSLLHPVVKDGVLVDPMLMGLGNYGQPDAFIDVGLLRKCSISYREYMESNAVRSVERRLMTEEEIIFGIEGDDSFNAMNRQSSMGYPWNMVPRPGYKGKEFIFGKGPTYDIENLHYAAFKEIVEAKEEMIANGIRPEFYFCDNLKDEKLKKEKVQEGKTRIFSAANCELIYLTRKYFGAFSRWYNLNRTSNGSAIGLNVYGPEWDMLARKLLCVGGSTDNNAYGAGDYSKFDGSEKSVVLWEILHLINTWYNDDPQNQIMRTRLWYEVTNSIHVVGDCVMMWNNSLPSGHPLTAVINSIYNNLAFRFVWARIVGANNVRDISTFDKNVYLITLGDDNLFAVSRYYRDVFTEERISVAMSELGLKYTSDTKDGVNLKLRNLWEVSFLKRRFRYEEVVGRFVAPLDFDTVMQVSYFCKRNLDVNLAVCENIETTLKELSLYGKDVFEEHFPRIKLAFERHLSPSLRIVTDTWESALDKVLSDVKYI